MIRPIALFVFLCVLQGCGQKGALFIPESQPQKEAVQLPDANNSAVQPLLKSQ